MADCSEETGDNFDSERNQSDGCWNSKSNSEQSTNHSQHRNRIRREQCRTPNSTVQKVTRARTTICLSSPIGWVPKEQCSHTQRTLFSPAWRLKRLRLDIDLFLYIFFVWLFFFLLTLCWTFIVYFLNISVNSYANIFIETVHRFIFFSIVPVFLKKKQTKIIKGVTSLCDVLTYAMWLKLASHVSLTSCFEIRFACMLFGADESFFY